MYLVADIYINPIYIILLGVITGVMTSAFRVGGALLTVPCLIMLKVPVITIVATQPFIMLFSALLSTLSNYKNIDFSKTSIKINALLAIGLVFGSLFGYSTLKQISTIKGFDLYYSYAYMFVTSFFGVLIISQSLKNKAKTIAYVDIASINYNKAKVTGSGLISAFLSVILGLGGNVFVVPLLTSFAKLPTYYIKNNSYISLTMLTFISSSIAFATLYVSFSFTLAIFTIVGIFAGIYIGKIINKNVSYNTIRLVPGLLLIAVTCIMFYKTIIL